MSHRMRRKERGKTQERKAIYNIQSNEQTIYDKQITIHKKLMPKITGIERELTRLNC
jgi:hypothetical protein